MTQLPPPTEDIARLVGLIGPEATLKEALDLMKAYNISGIPVVESAGDGVRNHGRLVGILNPLPRPCRRPARFWCTAASVAE